MEKLVLVDGNSIMNRAFYGIMGSKTLTTKNGMYTNAIYGFLAILFKLLEDEKPEYLAVSFDLKGPTVRHEMYEGYKANRKGMPDELAQQMPVIKEILKAMNIDIVEMQGYEGDDIIGTLSRYGEKKGLEVIILSGDRDTFQLATNKVHIRIPRTKGGKTETEVYDREKIKETYGIEPKQLIEVKGLQGDTSDNIPGVPGIGEKTALSLIQKFGTIDNLYKKLEEGESGLKGKQKEKIEQNKELAYLSRKLGEINTHVPIEDTLEELKVEEWDKEKVLEIFKELNFKRYIERFNLQGDAKTTEKSKNIEEEYQLKDKTVDEIKAIIKEQKQMIFYLNTVSDKNEEKIIKEKIVGIGIFNNKEKEAYYINLDAIPNGIQNLKDIFEDEEIAKIGIELGRTYILLKQEGIDLKGIKFDCSISAYILNPTDNKLKIENLADRFLEIDINEVIGEEGEGKQINLFDNMENSSEEQEKVDNSNKKKYTFFAYLISRLQETTKKKLEEIDALKLFEEIDMPTVEVLANMQWNGMYADEEELESFGNKTLDRVF